MATLGTNGSAGTLSCATDAETCQVVLSSGSGTTFRCKAAADNTDNVLVNVANVHAASDFDVLEPGDMVFYRGVTASVTLTFKSASGTQSLHVGASTGR